MTGKRVSAAAVVLAAALVAGFFAGPAAAVTRETNDPIEIELSVHGGERGVFLPGSEVAFYVKPAEDCYLAVYNIDARGRVSLLFPRSAEDNARVDGGERIRIPERSAGYRLYLGDDPGTEYVVAVASANSMDLAGLFPSGELTSADQIWQDENLGQQGLDQATWIQDDPYTAMDLIEDRLVPEGERSDRWGEHYVSMRVGNDASAGTVAGGSRVTRVEVVNRGYDQGYWGGPYWAYSGVFADPWGWGYRSRSYLSVTWCDPCWDPWYNPWYDPFYSAAWWDGYGYGGGFGFGWGWNDWDRGDHRHHGDHWSDGDAGSYWGSRVKWKTLPAPPGGGTTKWKTGSVALAAASPAIGVQPPPVKMKMGRLEPSRATRYTRTRVTDAARATRGAGVPGEPRVTRETGRTRDTAPNTQPVQAWDPSGDRSHDQSPDTGREKVRESRPERREQPAREKTRSEDKRGGGGGNRGGGGKRR